MKNVENKIKKDANNSSFEFKEEYWDQALIKLKHAERMLLAKRFFWTIGLVALIGGATYFAYNGLGNDTVEQSAILSQLSDNKGNTQSNSAEKSKMFYDKLDNKNESNQDVPLLTSENGSTASTSDATPYNPQKNRPRINNSLFSNTGFSNTNSNSLNQSSKTTNNDLENFSINTTITEFESLRNGSSNTINSQSFNEISGGRSKINANSTVTNITDNSINTSVSQDKAGTNKIAVEENPEIETPNTLDSNQQQETKPEVEVEKSGFKSSFSLQVFAGGLAAKELKEESKLNASIPYVGLDLTYKFSQPLSVSTGVGFYSRTINSDPVDYYFDQYNFGLNRTVATFTLKSSSWLEIPFKLNYNFYKGHFIGIGGSYSHNLSAKNDIVTNLSFSNEDEISTINQIQEDYKNYTGFYNNNFSALISYKYMYNRFGGEIKYHFGLSDMLNDERMKSVSFDRNSRFTFTISYSLF